MNKKLILPDEAREEDTNVIPFKRSPITKPDMLIPTGNWLIDLPENTVFLAQHIHERNNYNLIIRQKVKAMDECIMLIHPTQEMEWVDARRYVNTWRYMKTIAMVENTDERPVEEKSEEVEGNRTDPA